MKLIKINTNHYVVVDETIQPVNGYYYDSFIKDIRNTNGAEYGKGKHYWQITHSTQPLGVKPITDKVVIEEDKDGNPLMSAQYVELDMSCTVKQLSLQEVKELIGDVDVEKKAREEHEQALKRGGPEYASGYYEGLLDGYNQALEDNKEKKYTYYDIENAFNSGRGYGVPDNIKDFNSFIQSIQPKTEWEVEIVDGKLKLKV